MRVVALAVVCLVIVSAPTRADACSCRAPGPVCEELFFGTVFVGKAVSQAEVPRKLAIRVTFEVIEVLNGGIATKTVDVETPSEGSMCGARFRDGATYVVYAGGDAASGLAVSACSRTHVVGDMSKDADIVFARTAKKSTATKARVNGTVSISGSGSSQNGAGLEVRVKGTQIATRTSASGAFVLELAPGAYELEVPVKGLRPRRGETFALNIGHAAWCPRPHLAVVWDGQIQGRVTYPDGTAASGVRVVVRGKPGMDEAWRTDATTDANGRYTLHEVEAGDWLVLVSPSEEGLPSTHSPHPTTYYPGTPDAKQAKRVSIKRAGVAQNIDFVVPPPLTVVTFHGDVVAADGKRAPKASIGVSPKGVNRSSANIADDNGSFTMDELAGLEIVVRACSDDDRRKCVEVTTKVEPSMKRLTLKLPK
jgi:hypothetical protein